MKKLLATVLAGAMALSSLTLTAGAADSYNAYIGLQADGTLWAFRNAYDDADYGLGTDYFQSIYSTNAGESLGGSFTDAAITADGEYSVKMDGYDFTSDSAITQMNLIFISTDIPVDAGVTISDIKLYIDGNYIQTVDYVTEDGLDTMKAVIVNTWNDAAPVAAATCAIPESSVEIKFTVSGLGDAEETGAVAPIAVVSVVALVSAGVIVASKKRA